MIRVLLVDDHALVRVGVRRLLEGIEDIEVIAEAVDGEEALRLARELKPDVVLMDIRMPGIGGVNAIQKILHIDPEIKVISLTSYTNDAFFINLLEVGVLGYLTKGAGTDEMVHAIRAVYAGQRYINADIANRFVLKGLGKAHGSRFDVLSEREYEIASRIIHGQEVQAIADELTLNPKTVNSYRYRIFEKLKINHDVSLTLLALQEGLLTLLDAEPETV